MLFFSFAYSPSLYNKCLICLPYLFFADFQVITFFYNYFSSSDAHARFGLFVDEYDGTVSSYMIFP
jgi:hypothetical protein